MTKEELRGLNETLNSWERFFQREVLQSLPVAVGLPTGDNCNLRCIFCTERDEKSVYRYHNVSFSQFLAFAEPLRFASYIQIQGWGEPLFNPDYERIFDYVAQGSQGALISFNTNGVMLDGLWIEKLASVSNMHINVSLNAASRETYRSLMGRDHFHRVIDNIASLTREESKREIERSLCFRLHGGHGAEYTRASRIGRSGSRFRSGYGCASRSIGLERRAEEGFSL